MYFAIASKNLFRQRLRTLLTMFGIVIGIASLVIFLGLSEGIKKALFQTIVKQSPLTQITVQPEQKVGFFRLALMDTKNNITKENLEQIIKIPFVTQISPEIKYDNIASAQISFLGQVFQTDTMIFGVPYDFIASDTKISKDEWENASEPYPIMISRRIIDLYNFTVAPTANLPRFTEQDLKGLEINILPDFSSFFPQAKSDTKTFKGKIVGFSDRAELIGITLPLQAVIKLNKDRTPGYIENYSKLFLTVDSPENIEKVNTEIEKLNLNSSSPQQEIRIIQENFKIITLGLTLISLIILVVSGLMIANTFYASVAERKHEIGIMRAIGATRANIRWIFLTEAAMIGFISGCIGISSGVASSFVIDGYAIRSLPEITQKPDTIFLHTPGNLLIALAISIGISIIFALLPAIKASSMQPVEALSD